MATAATSSPNNKYTEKVIISCTVQLICHTIPYYCSHQTCFSLITYHDITGSHNITVWASKERCRKPFIWYKPKLRKQKLEENDQMPNYDQKAICTVLLSKHYLRLCHLVIIDKMNDIWRFVNWFQSFIMRSVGSYFVENFCTLKWS